MLNELGDPLGPQLWARLVEAVRRADRRRERVHPGLLDEPRRDLDGMHLARPRRSPTAVLDAEHALDLALDVRAVALGLGDDLDRLAGVLSDVELRSRRTGPSSSPPRRQIVIHSTVGTVIEMQRHRDRQPRRPAPATC